MPHRSFTGLVGLAALIVALLGLPSAASAANSCDVGTVDKTWVGNTDASWFTASNWSPVNAADRRARTSASRSRTRARTRYR